VILEDKQAAKKELQAMIAQAKFGKASSRVVIEQFLSGIEFSVFAITDGITYQLLPVAKDYKRIGEGDTGLNTGGMGAVSPVPICTEEVMDKVIETIVAPTIKGLATDGLVYKGFIFFGLILVGDTPMVIEYNCRLGDPETEAVIPRLQSDLVEHLSAIFNGKLTNQIIVQDQRTACTVVAVSGGYPEEYEKNKVIHGIPENTSDKLVFHAGTKTRGAEVLTNGGRVLAVTSYGNNISEAIGKSNAVLAKIDYERKYYRRDIGWEFK